MSDQNIAPFEGQEPGQVSAEPTEGLDAPVTVSRLQAELRRMELLVAQANKAAQDAISRTQHLTDAQESRIAKKLKAWEDNLKNQGIPVDDDLRKQARNQVALSELNAPSEPTASSRDATSDLVSKADFDAQVQMVNNRIAELTRETGVSFDDPAFADFDRHNPDPKAALADVERRYAAIRQRSQSAQPGPGAATRLPVPSGGVGGDSIANISDPHELIRMGLKKLGTR